MSAPSNRSRPASRSFSTAQPWRARRARASRARIIHARRALRERSPASIAAMSRDLRLLAGAAGLSALGDFLAFLPLVIHVQQRTGSAFAVAALFLALWGPVVVGAGVAGAIVDRFENRALLVGVSAAQAAIVAGIALSIDSLGVLIVLVALLGFCVAVVQPAEFALVPAAAGAGRRAGQRQDGGGPLARVHLRPAGRRRARRRRAALGGARDRRGVVRRRRGRGTRAARAATARAQLRHPRARARRRRGCCSASGSWRSRSAERSRRSRSSR